MLEQEEFRKCLIILGRAIRNAKQIASAVGNIIGAMENFIVIGSCRPLSTAVDVLIILVNGHP